MQYNQPYGEPPEVVVGDKPYVNGNPSTGTMGSIPPAASIEYPQREIVNIVTDAGIVPDNGDLHQVSRAVQSGTLIRGIDTGTVNVVSIGLTPALADYIDGMFVWVRIAITNTGPAVCSISGLGGRNIVRRGGAVLQPGDLPGGFYALLVYNGLTGHANFELYGASYAPATGIPVLSANSNLYVNGTTGDDTAYDGTSAVVSGPHGPFKTITRAVTETYKYGPSVYTMTINVAAATYAEAVQIPNVIGPACIINGAGITQTFVNGATSLNTFNVNSANRLTVSNLCAQTQGGVGPPCIFSASGGGHITTNNTASRGATPGYIWEAYSGYITCGTHTFNAGSSANVIWGSYFGGFLAWTQYSVFTFAGAFTITSGGAACVCSANGSCEVPVPGSPTFPGAGFVSGYKYWATGNGCIITQANGVSYFPGTLAGYVTTGGVYE